MMMKVSMCEFCAGIHEGATESMSNSEAFPGTLLSALPEFHASVIVSSIKTREYFHATCKMIVLIILTTADKRLSTPTRFFKNSKCAQAV